MVRRAFSVISHLSMAPVLDASFRTENDSVQLGALLHAGSIASLEG
jgi:hypothetical protein